MNAKVAIVTRTKNRPVLLERALASIFSQTFDDLVVVLVNDGGDVDALDRVLAARSEAERAKVVRIDNTESRGRWGSMDEAIDAADSEFFILHDDDDAWHPDFLATTVAYLDEHAGDAGVATRTELVYEEIVDGRPVELRREPFATAFTEVSLLETLKQNYVPPIAMLFRRSVFATIGRFDSALPVLGDWDFNLRLLSRYTLGFIDGEPLAYWYHREASTGDLGNSVVADARRHQMYNLAIRDRHLRRFLSGDAAESAVPGSGELAPLLLAGELAREIDTKADAARAANAAYLDAWKRENIAHLELVKDSLALGTTDAAIEISRLRGEVRVLRDAVAELRETTDSLVSMLRDVWEADRAAQRLHKSRP